MPKNSSTRLCPLQDILTASKGKGRFLAFRRCVLRKPSLSWHLCGICLYWLTRGLCSSWLAWLDCIFLKSASFGLWFDDLSSVLERSFKLGWSVHVTQGHCRLPSALECRLLLLVKTKLRTYFLYWYYDYVTFFNWKPRRDSFSWLTCRDLVTSLGE